MSKRDLCEVINKVMAKVPEDWPTLLARLNDLHGSVRFTAPEVMGQRWADLAVILEESIGEPEHGWQEEISAIVLGSADEVGYLAAEVVPEEEVQKMPARGPIAAGQALQVREGAAVPVAATTPGDLLRYALEQNADLDKLERLMDLQQRWQAEQARMKFTAAVAAFRAEAPVISKDGLVDYQPSGKPRVRYRHATLGNVLATIREPMSRHGLSHQWNTTQENKGITITCRVTHAAGHYEETSLCAGPDTSGGKNPIQQVASTVTYLQRYTLLSLLGLATGDQDDDGRASTAGDAQGQQRQQQREPQPAAKPRPPEADANAEAQARVAKVERAFRRWGVLLVDLEKKLGPAERWGDEQYKQLNVWRLAFGNAPASSWPELARTTFDLEPGAMG